MTARRSWTGRGLSTGIGAGCLRRLEQELEVQTREGTAVDVKCEVNYPARSELLAEQVAQLLDVIAALGPPCRVEPV